MRSHQIRRNTLIIMIIVIPISLLMWYIVGDNLNNKKATSKTNSVSPNNKRSDADVPRLTTSVTGEEATVEPVENIRIEKYKLDDLPDELFTEPLGMIIAQKRTDRIIENLKKETLEESLVNLDNVDMFYYPGYYSEAFLSKPFDKVQKIISNRRFIKLYDELRSKSQNEQYKYLNETLNDKLSQYHNLLSRFNNPNPSREDNLELSRISDVPGKPRTLRGTMLAVQSISLLCGTLGNVQMWPELHEAFNIPVIDRKTLDDYDSIVRRSLNNHPMFPIGIQG